jgi:hypothetical protein
MRTPHALPLVDGGKYLPMQAKLCPGRRNLACVGVGPDASGNRVLALSQAPVNQLLEAALMALAYATSERGRLRRFAVNSFA